MGCSLWVVAVAILWQFRPMSCRNVALSASAPAMAEAPLGRSPSQNDYASRSRGWPLRFMPHGGAGADISRVRWRCSLHARFVSTAGSIQVRTDRRRHGREGRDTMTKKIEGGPSRPVKPATRLVTGGRDPFAHHGYVNPPVYHASTLLHRSAEDYLAHRGRYQYGRKLTPTSEAL